MKPTKHATTNYRMIRPFLDAVNTSEDGRRRFLADGYMPLVVENLGYKFHGGTVYSVTHYGEQNGDAMRDPDMTISVDSEAGTVDPLTFQNDYMGLYQEVYVTEGERERYRPGLRTDLDKFLWFWLKNIQDQGFSPDVYEGGKSDEDDFNDVDPAAIRAALEDAEKNGSAFISQVRADAEQIAADEARDEMPAVAFGDLTQYALFA